MRNIKKNIEKINSLLDEINRYENYKEKLAEKIRILFNEYQQKKYTHEQYTHRMKLILEGKTKDEWNSYYTAYNYSLLKQIEEINYEIFYEAYENKDFESIKPIIAIVSEKQKQGHQDSKDTKLKLLADEHVKLKQIGKIESKQDKKDKEVFDALVQLEKKEQKKISELERKDALLKDQKEK